MSSFLSDFKRAFVQEARTTADTPLLWLTGIVVPVFWCLAVVAVFATGLMRNIPVGLVDYDNSAESRDLIRSLDAVASVDFINYEKVETYKDFGGIRIEDDILITASGCRMLGHERIPYHIDDVEEFMAQRTN